MSNESPAAIIYSSDGYEATVKNATTIVAGTPAIIIAGSDGTNSRYATLDSSGRLTISGAGTAGTATGGVVTIQGIAGGTNVPVSFASVGTTGAAVPGSANYIGISDGTNLVGPRGSTTAPGGTEFAIITRNIPSGTQTVAGSGNFNVIGTGSAGTAATGVVTIQGIVGMTAVSISGTVTSNIGTTGGLALDATLAKLTISPGTALGSNTLAMVGGSVTTAAPTYTTGTINNLSLTTGGLLRVDGSGVTQPVSGTVTANAGTGNFIVIGTGTDNTTNSTAKLPVLAAVATTAAPSYTTGNMVPLSTDTAGALRVTGTVTAANASVSTTGTAPPGSATYVGGSVTTAAPTYTTGQMSALSLTTGGLLRVDGSGTTQPVSGSVTVTQATPANLRAQTAAESATGASPPALAIYAGGSVTTAAPSYTTGQMNALSLTTTGLLRVDGSGTTQPVSGTVTANIGTTGGLALDVTLTGGTQTTRITDGTNTATVKAASTAAVAADKALVVAISPNNSITAAPAKSTTGTATNVTSSATNVTLLASNATRLGATIYNDGNKRLYIKLGAGASATSFTQMLFGQGYYEVPANYSGQIDAIWESAAGFARVTELT